MKQEERRQQTMRLLMETTKELVLEKGCPFVTMQDIMNRSGLSKGAIFHYVKSKDEIFVRLLDERLEETNARFLHEIEQGRLTFEEPMQVIRESIVAYGEAHDATNKVLMYLLGKEDAPVVAAGLKRYYERSVALSRLWIETGQRHGRIPETIDAESTAELFVLLTFGLRVRASIPDAKAVVSGHDLASFIADKLHPR
ncbi:TetR/AcrR family transcriptional regulator [Paenibacillus flagellatus]|uniref:TetR/AcrR family transcriptional regulator n=1 Tax=Paenibacillus flagellatus TaxID=2211139 RepID=A0A2V5L2N3_9BACL|nr:TetR/AcrR family transcriptional regulator [Paenibacillus flagellatus]PYI56976.1 TetR/AcrR family transcriptional regulator [Paenibacillus flagellatus]